MVKRFFGLPALAAGAVALGVGAFTPSQAAAATKDFSSFGWMADLDPGVDLTVLNTGGSTITLALEKTADFTSTSPLNIVFRQVGTTSVSHIVIADENVLNDSGSAWSSFGFSLSGMSNNGVVPTFDAAASAGFTAGTQLPTLTFGSGNTQATASGGSVASGTFPANLFQPGASGDLVINADPFAAGNGTQRFTFTETPNPSSAPPVIPLPAAAWPTFAMLAGLGLVGTSKRLGKAAS